MLNKVKDYIKKNNLLNHKELYIVALSGGADSVALLLLLDELGYKIHAAHCNFHLRGEESDRDERFCEFLCQQKDIPFHRVHFDTKTYAEIHKVSVEMAARELRYRYFEQLRLDVGAAGICVAHHREDSVETVLLNLVRGTGIRGLTGIQPRNGKILRPLLCVSRQEIEVYLQVKGQDYVTDSTNFEDDVLRNKIRLNVIPVLKELNPAVCENIQNMTMHLTEAQNVLDNIIEKYRKVKHVTFKELDELGSREYLLFEWLKNYGFNGSQVQQIMEAETGGIVTSSLKYDVLKDRDSYIVEPSLSPMIPLRIPEDGTYILNEEVKFTVKKEPVWVSKNPDIATLDAKKVCFPLTIRRVKEGDWMIPYGMKGRKLLSDLMTDRKMTLFEKRRQLVVVDAHDTIIWLVGIRINNQCMVDNTTTEVVEIAYSFVI